MSEKSRLEEFINKANKVHDNKYDYSKTEYVNAKTKICIICPKHGEFYQTPNNHLSGQGCPRCKFEKLSKLYCSNKDEFIEKANKLHNNKYDYSKVEYKGNKIKVCIICPIHGEFYQSPNTHLRGIGCKQCGIEVRTAKRSMKLDEFIEKARKIHGDKFNYDKVEYVNNRVKICIICPIHGEFYQTPRDHLVGAGCPKCNSSKLEESVLKLLQENNIEFSYQHKFEWLGMKSLDFYLPKHNIAIECQGIQHFMESGMFTTSRVRSIKERDAEKLKLCDEHGIKLLYYSNLYIEYPYKVFENDNELLEEIKK